MERQEEPFDFETLIRMASIAQNATGTTNPIQFYTEEIGEQILRKDTIETDIKRVIAGEKDTLYLVYQPIVDAHQGSIISFEALARLQSPLLGSISPLEFITIAEERHLIIPLGKIILEHTALFLKRLADGGYGSYPIAVNISMLQLLDETFIKTLERTITKTGIRAEQLEFELTESVFSNNLEFLSQQVDRIHSMGIRIAIDDFGTGFSSLSRIGDLKVDTLKLDKQFIESFTNSKATGISSDIISMGRHLGKRVIAEGVETEVQRQVLLGMECSLMQGYLFSRPVGEDEIIALLAKESADN